MERKNDIQKIFISAGEASGDIYGAELAVALKKHVKNAELHGIGLSRMKKAGVRLLLNMEKHSVMGVTEILTSLFENYKNIRLAGNFFVEAGIDALVLIDYAGFNVRLAKLARAAGIPVYFFIPPKLWAWGEFRVKKLRSCVDRIYSIFPFEKKFFEDRGIETKFFGHPIFDVIKASGFDFKKFLDGEKHAGKRIKNKIILMPGSRKAEIENQLPLIKKCAAAINENYSKTIEGLEFIIPIAPSTDTALLKKKLKNAGFPYKFVEKDDSKYQCFSEAALAIATSGTATLELALFGVPMVILYKVALLTELAGRILVNTKFVGLPNIIHGASVVPELLQREANFDNVMYHASKIIENQRYGEKMRQLLLETPELLKFNAAGSPIDLIARDIAAN